MKKVQRAWGWLVGLWGGMAVALGAFGAHALKEKLEGLESVGIWETAVFYHLSHAVAALAWRLSGRRSAPVICWVIGSALFSLSLYGLALEGPRWLGPVTPVGGLLMLLGWGWAAVDMGRDQHNSSNEQI